MTRQKYFNYNLNKIIRYLILSDLIFYSGWGLISPVFAIFLLDSIVGGSAFVVGMASGVHLIVRSLLRVPFGVLADKGQKISYHLMFWGLLLAAFVPVGYIYSHSPMDIYLLQSFLGITLAMSTAGWAGLFARHMDKGKESTEWGVDAVAVGIGPGIAGILGGVALTYMSFNIVFIIVTIVGFAGVLLLLAIKKDVMGKTKLLFGKIPHAQLYEVRRLKKARV